MFLCQGTTKYVYIDLKRVLSNLTLGQGKIDLMSMSKTRNCVNLYITRLVLMRQGCFYHFVVTLDQKTVATSQTNAPFEKLVLILVYGEKSISFLTCDFFEVLRVVEEN